MKRILLFLSTVLIGLVIIYFTYYYTTESSKLKTAEAKKMQLDLEANFSKVDMQGSVTHYNIDSLKRLVFDTLKNDNLKQKQVLHIADSITYSRLITQKP